MHMGYSGTQKVKDNMMRPIASSEHESDLPWPAAALQLIVDSAPALIHTGLPDGYLDFFNQAWLKYLGQPLEELQVGNGRQ
jgi:hypothetical protein